MISGVIKTPLKQFEDSRGKVMHMLRCNDPHFKKFGEVYFSWIYAGSIKAWKLHKKSIMNFAVPIGAILLVLYDDRHDSATYGEVNEIHVGCENYNLLTIPNNIWYGFSPLDDKPAMITNCTTLPHQSSEVETRDMFDSAIPYSWRCQYELALL